MNCPKHIENLADPKRFEKELERERIEELTSLLAGPEEDYIS